MQEFLSGVTARCAKIKPTPRDITKRQKISDCGTSVGSSENSSGSSKRWIAARNAQGRQLCGVAASHGKRKSAKPRKLFPSRWFRRGLDTGFRFGAAGKRFVHKFGIPQLSCFLVRQRGRRGRRSRGLGDGPFPQFLNCRLNSPDRGGRARRLA